LAPAFPAILVASGRVAPLVSGLPLFADKAFPILIEAFLPEFPFERIVRISREDLRPLDLFGSAFATNA
jgi:hypothetical protein